MLNNESINKHFIDGLGNEIFISSYEEPCCSPPYFVGSAIAEMNFYCYDSNGMKYNHKWKVDAKSELNLVGEMQEEIIPEDE